MIMSFSFTSLIRLLVLLAIGTTMLAVGVAKLDPPKPGVRARRLPKYTNINEYFLDAIDRTPHWMDAETGQIAAYPLEDGDVLQAASCSPWIDENHQYQIAGRWSNRTKDGPMSMSNDFGIARYAFPSGKMLDQVSTETVPVAPPCWFPGTRARILFTAGDGMLYTYAFEPEAKRTDGDPGPKRDIRPTALTWRCPKPGKGNVFMSDVTWPEDPRISDRVLVSLREQRLNPKGVRAYSQTRLYWLKLNLAGTEILEVGSLLSDDESHKTDREFDHRSPTVGKLANGTLALAYLRQRAGDPGWESRITPIEFETDPHRPRGLASRSVPLFPKCQPSHASFSADGRWVNAIRGSEARECRVARLPVERLFKDSN
jgi:hypothetical protein